jgi:hypothetical protein
VVEKVVMLMQSSTNPTPLLGVDAPSYPVVSQSIQLVVEKVVTPMQYLAKATHPLGANTPSYHVFLQSIYPMVEKLVASMQCSTDPTLLMRSDVSIDYVFSISSLVPSGQGGIMLTSSTTPPSPSMVYFYWNDLVEPPLPYFLPFQIRVEVNSKNI